MIDNNCLLVSVPKIRPSFFHLHRTKCGCHYDTYDHRLRRTGHLFRRWSLSETTLKFLLLETC